jgi:hypothetical protein
MPKKREYTIEVAQSAITGRFITKGYTRFIHNKCESG